MTFHLGRMAVVSLSVLIAACGSTRPEASPSPTSGAATIPSLPSWRSATVRATERAGFTEALRHSSPIAVGRTIWVRLPDGAWMPADPVERLDRDGIAAQGDRFVAIAGGSEITTSVDGFTWAAPAAGPSDFGPYAIASFAGGFLAFGESTGTTIGAWASRDGSIWAPVSSAPLGVRAGTTWPGHGLVAVSSSGPNVGVWASQDGISWSEASTPDVPAGGALFLSGVAAGPDGVVVIGDDGSGSVLTWFSRDLTTWSHPIETWGVDAQLMSVTAIDGGFVVTGSRNARPVAWLSTGGLDWSEFDLPQAKDQEGEAFACVDIDVSPVVFGYASKSAGNGGSNLTAYLVWTLDPAR